jgi:DNA-binding NtrC family response regulator
MKDPCSGFRPIVLIAQNDEDDLRILQEASLKYNKYDVVVATTGQEIVDKINETCFDAVIIGLRFSDLTGSTLAYLIHAFDPLIKIGFLTNYNTASLIEAVERLDCTFLNKNVELQNLDKLCEKIYHIATEIPCSDKLRISGRNSSEAYRNRYKEYKTLAIPESMKCKGV